MVGCQGYSRCLCVFFLCITIWLLGCGDRLPGYCYPAVIGGFKHITGWCDAEFFALISGC